MPDWLRWMGLTALAILGVASALPWGDRQLSVPDIARRKLWLWMMLVLPLVGMWLVSSFARPVYIVGRYDFVAFPAFALLVGLALAKVQAIARVGLAFALGLTLMFSIPIGVKLARYYELAVQPKLPSARAMANSLAADVRNGDVVVFTGLRGVRLHYYLGRLGIEWSGAVCHESLTGRNFGCRMFPRETEQHPAVYDPEPVLTSPDAVRDDVAAFASALDQPGNVMWLVLQQGNFNQADPALLSVLEEMGFQLTQAGSAQTGDIIRVRRAE